jgi:4-hydroxybenzoate polyprenyltransferase
VSLVAPESSADGVPSVKPRRSLLRASVAALRPHQWSKNALLLLPMVLAPGLPTPAVVVQALLAVMAFSLSASAGYVLNDVLDIKADRAHPTKRHRPFASGELPVALGPVLVIALVAVSFGLSLLLLPYAFVIMLGIYFAGTLSYSFYLKRQLLVDVLVLAGLYTHRILAGGMATGVHVSSWLLGFSMFFFTSLAFAKRYVELKAASDNSQISPRWCSCCTSRATPCASTTARHPFCGSSCRSCCTGWVACGCWLAAGRCKTTPSSSRSKICSV